jgi:hypothetical protein
MAGNLVQGSQATERVMDAELPAYGSSEDPCGSPSASAEPGERARWQRTAAVTVRYEVVVVDGPDGQHLRERQAVAMLRALRWFAENSGHRADEPVR